MAQQPAYPAQSPPSASPPPKRKKRASCLQRIIIAGIIGGFVLVALIGAGYFAYSSGAIGQREVLNLIGQGYADIRLNNLTDDTLYWDLQRWDGEANSYERHASDSMDALDLGGRSVEAGAYILTLSTDSGQPAEVTCYFDMAQGDVMQFTVVPEGIAVTREGFTATSAADLRADTSTLCQGGN